MAAAYSIAAAAIYGSTSTVTTEAVTGCHVLNISRYSRTKGLLGLGNGFASATFTAGGHRWHIDYYADGYDDDDSDCICFDLVLENPNEDAPAVKAGFVFTLLDCAGEPVPEYTKVWECSAFSAAIPSWGFQRFIEREVLEESPYLVADRFTVRCDVTVYKEASSGGAEIAPAAANAAEIDAAVAPPPPTPAVARRGLGVYVGRLLFVLMVTLFAASWLEFMC